MGLSHVIPAGVVFIPLFIIVTTIPGITNTILQINQAAVDVSDLENSILNTHFQISNLTVPGGESFIYFDVKNTGATKLWDYDNFDLLVTYEGIVGSSATNVTESLTYSETGPIGDPIRFDTASNFGGFCIVNCSFLHTVNPGNDRILIVGINTAGGTGISSVTYDGDQVLTQIRSDDNGGSAHTSLWYLVNPRTGTKTIQITLLGLDRVVAGGISLTGVDQTNPINANNGATGTSSAPSVSITTTTAETWIVDVVGTSGGSMTAGDGQVEQWEDAMLTTVAAGSIELTSSSGTYAMEWTNSAGSRNWAISTAALKPSGLACCVSIGNWNIDSISVDSIDPNIINNNETASISGKVSYQIVDNGKMTITFSTDNGIKASSFVTPS